MINRFEGEFSFLRNFYELQIPIRIKGVAYYTSEHFYQAHKSLNFADRIWIAGLPTAAQAKTAGGPKGFDGRKISVRPDLKEVRTEIMYMGLVLKFISNITLSEKLINTAPRVLIEGNHWHDNFWGRCSCEKCFNADGQNNLGRLLMMARRLMFTLQL